jgi:hypothetical protein
LQSQFGRRLPAAAVAGVWLYHGLWCKILGRCADQLRVVEDLPGMPPTLARPALTALGFAEVALAAWVISGRRPVDAARAETGLLVAMNGGGLAFSRKHIVAPRALLAENLAFLALVWWTGLSERQAA